MPLGEVQISVELDDEDRVYYGSAEPVTGRVVLEYKKKFGTRKDSHQDQTPLFCPLNLELRFQGRLDANANDRTGASTAAHHNRILFTKTIPVHDGPFQAVPGDRKCFPFAMCFPDRIQPRVVQQSEAFQGDTFHQVEDDCPLLPPSFNTEFTAKRIGERSSVSIEYVLDALVQLPGIDVKTLRFLRQCRVRYERPRLHQPPLTGFSFFGANITMAGPKMTSKVPERQGFRARAKSLLQGREISYTYQLTCSRIPKEICQGAHITCDLQAGLVDVNGGDGQPDMPDLTVESFKIKILQYTALLAEDTGKPIATDVQIVQTLRSPVEVVVFSKFKNTHHIQTLDTLDGSLAPSSFSIQSLNRTYKLRLEVEVSSGGQTRQVRKDVPLVVHPPLIRDDEQYRPGTDHTCREYGTERPRLIRLPSEALPSYDDATADLGMPPLDEYVDRRTTQTTHEAASSPVAVIG